MVKIHVWLEKLFFVGIGADFAKWNSRRATKKQVLSPAVTQSAVVHTLLRLERNSWPGKISVNIYEKACGLFDKLHPDWDKGDVVWDIEVILNSLDPWYSLCMCVMGNVYVSSNCVLSLLCGIADQAVKGITVVQWLSEVQALIWHMSTCPTVYPVISLQAQSDQNTHPHLLSSSTHSACWFVLNWLEETDFRQD